MIDTENRVNYKWAVDRRATGNRYVVAASYSVDSQGNLVFYSYLPNGDYAQSYTFASGAWLSVSLFQPDLIDFKGILGS